MTCLFTGGFLEMKEIFYRFNSSAFVAWVLGAVTYRINPRKSTAYHGIDFPPLSLSSKIA
jgi:hypothetical protein